MFVAYCISSKPVSVLIVVLKFAFVFSPSVYVNPRPLCLPSFHSPSYLVPSTYVKTPRPCGLPSQLGYGTTTRRCTFLNGTCNIVIDTRMPCIKRLDQKVAAIDPHRLAMHQNTSAGLKFASPLKTTNLFYNGLSPFVCALYIYIYIYIYLLIFVR